VLVGIQAAHHVAHALRVVVRNGNGRQDDVAPVVVAPVHHVAVAGVAATARQSGQSAHVAANPMAV